jgi:hypothetical protein
VQAPETLPSDSTPATRLRAAPELLGDQVPLSALFNGPGGPFYLPRVRSFKIDDNESPRPQDRVYFTFNYFDNLNRAVNQRLGADVHSIDLSRETFGIEKSFFNQDVSLGLRLPINTVTASSSDRDVNASHTTVGDLSFIFKYVLLRDESHGDPTDSEGSALLSMGLAITPPTGDDSLFGSTRFAIFRSTALQPFLGYLWTEDGWYIQGFSSLDIPTDINDALLWYNDISLRYQLYRSPERCRMVSEIAPVAELHLTTPIRHQGVLQATDPAGTPDSLNVTIGVDFLFFDRAKLGFGFVAPLTGPKVMDYEVLSQFKVVF